MSINTNEESLLFKTAKLRRLGSRGGRGRSGESQLSQDTSQPGGYSQGPLTQGGMSQSGLSQVRMRIITAALSNTSRRAGSWHEPGRPDVSGQRDAAA